MSAYYSRLYLLLALVHLATLGVAAPVKDTVIKGPMNVGEYHSYSDMAAHHPKPSPYPYHPSYRVTLKRSPDGPPTTGPPPAPQAQPAPAPAPAAPASGPPGPAGPAGPAGPPGYSLPYPYPPPYPYPYPSHGDGHMYHDERPHYEDERPHYEDEHAYYMAHHMPPHDYHDSRPLHDYAYDDDYRRTHLPSYDHYPLSPYDDHDDHRRPHDYDHYPSHGDDHYRDDYHHDHPHDDGHYDENQHKDKDKENKDKDKASDATNDSDPVRLATVDLPERRDHDDDSYYSRKQHSKQSDHDQMDVVAYKSGDHKHALPGLPQSASVGRRFATRQNSQPNLSDIPQLAARGRVSD